ncbi:MAG TPA: dethiobiotin synthase [Chthoniobacterales bacterium]
MSVFVTGGDTGAGKTRFAVWLLRMLRSSRLRSAGMKPICCGDRHDAELLLAASSEGLTIDDVNPMWLRTPAAPFTAAMVEGRSVDIEPLVKKFLELDHRFECVVVEGVGGWLVPIRADYFVANLAAALKLPVIVVAQNRLGCLNHTLLTIRSVEAHGLTCAGVVLNNFGGTVDIPSKTNPEVLQQCLSVPIVADFRDDLSEIPDWLRKMLPEIATPSRRSVHR